MKKVKIRNIEVYSGDKIENNDFYISHFENQGKQISNLLKAFGRNERKIIDKKSKETTLTMGIEVACKVMEASGLTGDDIDMILFSSQFPEFTVPTQALFIHNAIRGKKECLVMDVNVNCLGMISAVDSAVRYLTEKDSFKRALIVGSDYMTTHCKQTDELTYPMFGDSACAIILEKTDEDCGMIGSCYETNSNECAQVTFPRCGISNIYEKNNEDNMKLLWNPFTPTFIPKSVEKTLNKVLESHNLEKSDINKYCISQFASSMLDNIRNQLNEPKDKFIYIGDKYGYTGTTSPFIALYEGIKSGEIKKGDIVTFWSVGVFWTTCSMIFKY